MSSFKNLYPGGTTATSTSPVPADLGTISLRDEMISLLTGTDGEIPKGQTFILRRMRRDSDGNLTECACVDSFTQESTIDFRCSYCVLPDTKILTDTGIKSVQDVLPGMRVLNRNGEMKEVKNTFGRIYDGEITELHYTGRGKEVPLRLTSDHLVLVFRQETKCHKKARLGKVCNPEMCKSIGHCSVKNSYEKGETEFNPVLQYIPASEIKEGDFLVMPIPKNEESNFKEYLEIEWEKYITTSRPGTTKKLPYKIKFDKDLMYFLGWYVAEGSGNSPGRKSRGVVFSLNARHEMPVAEKLIKIGKEKFGLDGVITKRKNSYSMQVTFHSSLLSRWAHDICGRYSDCKRVPDIIWTAPRELKEEFLRGFMDGDGHKNQQYVQCTTIVSWNLAEELFYLALHLGYYPIIYGKRAYISKDDVSHAASWSVRWAEEYKNNGNKSFNNRHWTERFVHNEKIFTKIKEIKREKVKTPVYDLTMEGDPSFVANGVVVHNCFGHKYLFDEELVTGYKTNVSSVSASRAFDLAKTEFGALELPAMVFFFDYSVEPTINDKIVLIELDLEGDPVIPYNRTFLYEINLLRDLRSDRGRVEFWACYCANESIKTKGGYI